MHWKTILALHQSAAVTGCTDHHWRWMGWMCFFHWVTDPSNDETLEEFESSVENSHFPVATWIYKHQDVYTPQCCVEYIGNTLLLLGKVQFGTVVLCSSTVMKQGLLFWEEWNFCAAKFQLIGVWTFSVGQVGYSGYSVVPWGLWKLEKGKDYQKLLFYFAGVCVFKIACVFKYL